MNKQKQALVPSYFKCRIIVQTKLYSPVHMFAKQRQTANNKTANTTCDLLFVCVCMFLFMFATIRGRFFFTNQRLANYLKINPHALYTSVWRASLCSMDVDTTLLAQQFFKVQNKLIKFYFYKFCITKIHEL